MVDAPVKTPKYGSFHHIWEASVLLRSLDAETLHPVLEGGRLHIQDLCRAALTADQFLLLLQGRREICILFQSLSAKKQSNQSHTTDGCIQ